jgi:hypothetical protein
MVVMAAISLCRLLVIDVSFFLYLLGHVSVVALAVSFT